MPLNLTTVVLVLFTVFSAYYLRNNFKLPPMSRFMKPNQATVGAAAESNNLYNPATRPVGLFFGGTSGIGEAMATKLANQTNGRAHIVLLGRNEESAKRIFNGFPKHTANENEQSKYEFVKVDASSMKSVREVTSKLLKELPKVNYIVLSTGYLTLKGRDPAPDTNIDRKVACNFYGRFRFIYDLIPLVQKAAEQGEDVGVMSVLSAGAGGPVDTNDLLLEKGWSLRNALGYAVTYTDSTFEEFARRYPKIAFTHAYPGAVDTPMANAFPGVKYLAPLLRPLIAKPEECANIMWSRIWTTNGKWKSGAYQTNHHGRDIATRNPFVTPELRDIIWEHAVKVTE